MDERLARASHIVACARPAPPTTPQPYAGKTESAARALLGLSTPGRPRLEKVLGSGRQSQPGMHRLLVS
jgi:hypothetical protein